MNIRNARKAKSGLRHWFHRCNGCFKSVKDSGTGEICKSHLNAPKVANLSKKASVTVSAAVTDGVTMGHPCCCVKDCKEPLARVTDQYCHIHLNYGLQCCINDCGMPREPGFRTCALNEHREEEKSRKMRVRRPAHQRRQMLTGNEDDNGDNAASGRKVKVKGRFTRRWTHNEQLMVRPCGVVIGRATCYGSESMTAVKVRSSFRSGPHKTPLQVFSRSVFPETLPGLEPEILFFDNACGLRGHIKGCPDPSVLDRMAIVVDAFHFSGHKTSHETCQANCSPYKYPVLKKTDGTWLFNSSAAEQVNSWYGKFQSKVKEMNVVRYELFVSSSRREMITNTDITFSWMRSSTSGTD